MEFCWSQKCGEFGGASAEDQLQREYHRLLGDPRLGLKDETQATGVSQPRRRLQFAFWRRDESMKNLATVGPPC